MKLSEYKAACKKHTRSFLDGAISIPFNIVFGRKIGTKHIWPPKNYKKKYSFMYFWLIQRPLEDRGIFIPQESNKDGSEFRTFNNEHKIIDKMVQSATVPIEKFFVDIGASNGIDMSNTYLLAANGWKGLSLEIDVNAFARMAATYQLLPDVSLVRMRITPQNINQLLDCASVPKQFGVLNLDIDGYDYYVLEEVLKKYRPQIIVAEINTMIPASVCFSVSFSESFIWAENEFQGMSLAMLKKLAEKNKYKIVDVNGAAAFLMPEEISTHIPSLSLEALDSKIVALYKNIDPVLRKQLNLDSKKALDYVSNQLFKVEQKNKYFLAAYNKK